MRKIPIYGILISLVALLYSLSIILALYSLMPTFYLTLYMVGFFCNGMFPVFEIALAKNESTKGLPVISKHKMTLHIVLYILLMLIAGFLQLFVIDHGAFTDTFQTLVRVFGILMIVVPSLMMFVQTRLRKREKVIVESAKKSRTILSLVRMAFISDTAIGESLWNESSKRQRRSLFIVLTVGAVFPYLAFLLGAFSTKIWATMASLHVAVGGPKILFGIFPVAALLILVGMPIFTTLSALALTALEASEKEAAKAELKIARSIQFGLMPVSDPLIAGMQVSGATIPANEVGGDYYDYVWLNDEKTQLGIAIADVSGKAMKAAMTAVMTSGMIYSEIGNSQSPKAILQHINRPMYLKTEKQMFTALSFAVIDTTTKMLTFSNAGQMPPILKRRNETSYLKVTGSRLPLGIVEHIHYNELTEQLQSGDLLLFYTDGIPEAMNEKKELFGFDRLDQFVHQLNPAITAKEITDQLLAAVQMHTGTAQQHDDMTVVAVHVT